MSKVVSLKEAIGEIKDGDVILTGGIVEDRRPVAAAMAIRSCAVPSGSPRTSRTAT